MADHSSPGPGWELGADGHWKIPPLVPGGPPRPPNPSGPPGLPAPDAPWSVPPAAPPKAVGPGRVVAALGALVLVVIVLAAGAVTLLGTTNGRPGTGDGSVTAERAPTTATVESEPHDPSQEAAPTDQFGRAALTSVIDAAGPVMGPAWTVIDEADAGPGQPQAPCSPEGLGEGRVAGKVKTWGYQVDAAGSRGHLTVSVYEYATAALVRDDLARVASDDYQACQLERIPDDYSAAVTLTEPSVRRLDAPLGLDAVAYRITVHSAIGTRGSDDTTDLYSVGIGRLRVVVDVTRCCYTWDASGRRTVLAAVAIAASELQSLPVDDELTAAAAGTYLSEGPDPCATVTLDDFARAGLSDAATEGTMSHGPEDGETTCTWTLRDGQVAEVTTTVGGYEYHPPNSEPVEGIGDSAVWIADTAALVVRNRDRAFIIDLRSPDLAAARAHVLDLARVAIDRDLGRA